MAIAALLAVALVSAASLGLSAWASGSPGQQVASNRPVRILGPSAASFDPVVSSDAGTAQIISQLFESLTAVDSAGRVQPALSDSWRTENDGKRVIFHLRPGLRFSNGDTLLAEHVVASWMRVLNPAQPSELASLLDDVVGARSYREGAGSKADVGIRALSDAEVQIDLTSPASNLPAIASSPVLAVVPPSIDTKPSVLRPGSFVGSGAYTLSAETDTETTLLANPLYWAGPPAIKTVHVLSSIGGKSPVEEFENGNLDYTPINLWDALWIAFDKELGPSLRIEPSPSVDYYGFNTTKAPFDNVHVRRAFRLGIDWRRLIRLLDNPLRVPATGMVPPGVPGHSSVDFGPVFDLEQAKAELATAGYPNGVGFPKVTLVTPGTDLDEGIVRQLHDNLGIDIEYQTLDIDAYYDRLFADCPAMWQMGWVADYPGANDFLGILLGPGVTYNVGRWNSEEFNAAIEDALSAADAATMQQAFDRAQAIVRDDVPVIAVDYGAGYALARPGLLGALPNGQGLVRYAGLAWAADS